MKLHHIGIVVKNIENSTKIMNKFIGNTTTKILSNKTQKVNYCFINLGQTQIELIDHCFDTNEVDEIWITFPDPQIKHKRSKHCIGSNNARCSGNR